MIDFRLGKSTILNNVQSYSQVGWNECNGKRYYQ